jgi:hypothetical protein
VRPTRPSPPGPAPWAGPTAAVSASSSGTLRPSAARTSSTRYDGRPGPRAWMPSAPPRVTAWW